MNERKKEIFNQAAYLFRKRGYTASSMRDIAGAVGIEPSSLYSHISSKEAILKQICFDCAERFLSGIKLIQISNHSFETKIASIIDLHIAIAIDDPSSVTVFNDEWRFLNEKHLLLFKISRHTYESKVMEIFEEGLLFDTRPDLDPKVLMNSFLSSLKWLYHSSNKGYLQNNQKKIVIQLSNGFLNGIKSCS